jgi:hypothetical protein
MYDGNDSWRLSIPGSGIATPLIAVTPGTEYTFSLYINSDVPRLMGAMSIGTYDASGSFLQNYLGSYETTLAAHGWEPVSILYTAQPGEHYVQLKYARLPAGQGPTDGGSMWAYEFSLVAGVAVGPASSAKQAFSGSMVRVDPLGNWSVLRDGSWQPFTVIGIYNGGTVNSLQTYSNQGFNTLVCNTFSLGRLQQAKAAVSSFNPDGLLSMMDLSDFIDPRLPDYDNLSLLQQDLASLEASPLLSQVLCFYWDNEQYANYTVAQAVTDLVKHYDTNSAGIRQHPIYMLGGQQGLNPLYDSMVDVVGDYVRSPQTTAYQGDQPDIGQRITLTDDLPSQSRPFSLGTISNEAYWTHLQPLVYETLLAGGRGFTFYRDGGSNGYNGALSDPAATNITLRDWWPQLPGLVRQLDQLQPLLTLPAQSAWQLTSSNGQLVTGTRTENGQGYLFVVNPTASSQAAAFTVNGLPYTPQALQDFFSGWTVTPTKGNRFTLTLGPYQVRVYLVVGSGLPTPTVTVTDANGAYTGEPYPAAVSVTGVALTGGPSLDGITPTLTYYPGTTVSGVPLAGPPVAVGTYTVLANYGGSANYNSASAQSTFTISRAIPTLAVTVPSGPYSGFAPPITATIAGGGAPGASLEGIGITLTYFAGTAATGPALDGAPTAVGTYTVLAFFAGSTDYQSATTTASFAISPVRPTQLILAPNRFYDGTAHTATVTVEGKTGGANSSLEGITPTLTYYAGSSASGTALSAAPISPGTYTVQASFAGSADYQPAMSVITFIIYPARPTQMIIAPDGLYTGCPYPASVTVAGVSTLPGGTLEGFTPTLTYYAGISATGTPLPGAPTTVGTYTVRAYFPGSPDYQALTTLTHFTISPAFTAPRVIAPSGPWIGSPYVATATVKNVNGVAVASLEGVPITLTYYAGTTKSGTPLARAPSAQGKYTILADFAGSLDYLASVSVVTFTIT